MSTAQATVFVISCGQNPNLSDCLEALAEQQPPVRIERIHNVAPMSAAFQTMIDKCETEFFVECDEDMILFPDAINKMVEAMRREPEDVAFCVFWLYDTFLKMDLQGVKCYRTAVLKKYPYNTSIISCEKDQMDRMKADGYRIADYREVVGNHSPKWTPELIFERFFDLGEKWKRYGYGWLEDMPSRLFEKFLSDQNDISLYAYLGALSAVQNPEPQRHREKDYRLRTKEYLIARSWNSHPTQATLYLTGKCNLKCAWCLRQGTMAQVSPAPDFDETIIDEMMRRFPTITAVCLCGFGETLLHPNLIGIIRRLRRYNVFINLITNGVLLAERLPELLRDRPDALSISLNAASAEEHDKECGVPGAWDKIMDGLCMMYNYKRRWSELHAKDNGIPLFLSRVCTAQNLGGVAAFLQLAETLEVNGVDLHNILPHDVGTPETLAAFLGSVLTVEHAEQVKALKELPGARRVRSWPTVIDPAHPVRRCQYPFQSIAIDGNRNISICNSVWPPKPENGSIRDAKCWHNAYCEGLRMSFAEEEIEPACRYCFRNYQ